MRESPFYQHTNRTYKSLSALGLNKSAGLNKKVDKALGKLTKWCASLGLDPNAKKTSDYLRANAVLAYVGTHYAYSGSYYTAEDMLDHGCGTCFGFSELVLCFARKLGISKSWLCVPGRPVDHDGMSYGSQHRTVVAKIGGKWYDLDGNAALYGNFLPSQISASYARYLLGKSDTFASFT